MKKDTAKKLLKIFGILFYIGAAITILAGVLMLVVKIPEDTINQVKDLLGNVDLKGLNPVKVAGAVLSISGIFYILQGWSLRRAAKKEKTTLALVLFILAVASGVFSLIGSTSIVNSIITLAIDALILYAIIVVRKN